MKRKFFFVAAVIFSSQLHAQQDSLPTALNEVVLTANKYPKKQSETGKVVTIISREQLQKLQGRSLSEILNQQVGITVIGSNNNAGTNQNISIRGAAAGNVLVLVDGIPVNDPSVISNYFDLNLFSVYQVERIEILKGGQSTLYGSDAVAGVVNIITQKKSGKNFQLNAGVSAGSFGAFKQYAGISGNGTKNNYSLQYSHHTEKGFSSANDSTTKKDFDKDGFQQHVINGNYLFNITNRLQARLFGQYSYYNTDLDASAFTDEKDYTSKNKNMQSGAGLVYNHPNGTLHFNYHFNYTDRLYLDDSTFKSNPYVDFSKGQYIGRTHFAEIYNNSKWKNLELLTGMDYRFNNTQQDYYSTGPFGPFTAEPLSAKMSQFSPYASVLVKPVKGFNIEAGARLNIHSEYGNNLTYTLNPSYLLADKFKLFANFYSAFKTPTLYQLFDPLYGNGALKAEKSNIIETGIDAFFNAALRMRAVGFYRNTKDAIQFIYINPVTYDAEYQNISRQKNYGLETELFYKKNKWSAEANYTFTKGQLTSPYDETGSKLSADTTINNLYRVPVHAINVSVGYQLTPAFFTRAQLKTVSSRLEPVYAGKPVTLAPYYTVDFYLGYKCKSISLFADLRNITNQHYFDLLGYNTKRFNFTAGINYQL